MRASVHVDLPGWAAEGLEALKSRCEELSLQPRGTRGESGGQTGKNTLEMMKRWKVSCVTSKSTPKKDV